MWLQEPLITLRLRLRAFTEGDRQAVVRLASDDQVRRFLGGPSSSAEASRPIGTSWGIFAVAELETDRVLGSVDLSRERGELEISWAFLPEHWGSGFAREAAWAVMTWAFEQGADERIIAVTQSANTASCRLARRLGMEREATFEEFGAEQVRFVVTRRAAEELHRTHLRRPLR